METRIKKKYDCDGDLRFIPQRKTKLFGWWSFWSGGFGIYICPEKFDTKDEALEFLKRNEKIKIDRKKPAEYEYTDINYERNKKLRRILND